MATLKLSPARTRRWGRTYVSATDPVVVKAAIQQACSTAGLTKQTGQLCNGDHQSWLVEQTAPWYRVLWSALPQRVEWLLQEGHDGLEVTADFRLQPWYVIGVLAVSLCNIAAVLCYVAREHLSLSIGIPLDAAVSFIVGFGFLVLFWVAHLLGALGGKRSTAIWQEIVTTVERSGGSLEVSGTGMSLRHGASMLSLGIGTALSAAILILSDGQDVSVKPLLMKYLLLIFAVVFFLLLSAIALMVIKGFAFRTTAILGGLVAMMSMIFLLSIPAVWSLAPFSWRSAQTFLAIPDESAQPEHNSSASQTLAIDHRAQIASAKLATFRGLSLLYLSGSALLVAIATGLFFYGVSISVFTWPDIIGLKSARRAEAPRLAVSDKEVVRYFWALFLSAWMLSTAVIAVGLGSTVACLIQGFFPAFPYPESRPIELSAGMIASLLGVRPDNHSLLLVTRLLWILLCSGLLGIFVVSVGQLLHGRRTEHRRLAKLAAASIGSASAMTFAACCRRAGKPRVSLAVTGESRPVAAAHRIGLIFHKSFIEVSEGALTALREEERHALFCHELAHLRGGDCLIDSVARWLGRISFTGDGFARVIQDSYANERDADSTAVEQLGASPAALASCLRKLRSIEWLLKDLRSQDQANNRFRAWIEARLRRLMPGVEQPGELVTARARLGTWGRWSVSWYLFLRQYFYGLEYHYWHPEYEERIANLERLQRSRQGAVVEDLKGAVDAGVV